MIFLVASGAGCYQEEKHIRVMRSPRFVVLMLLGC